MSERLPDDTWKLIAKVHAHTKSMILLAEEFDPNHNFFLPPIIQQRDAWDHVVRAEGARLGVGRQNDEDYRRINMDKALAHSYRAFFDIADWLGMVYRERIAAEMAVFSPATIDAVFGKYSGTIRPAIEECHHRIAEVRGAKDIGNSWNAPEEPPSAHSPQHPLKIIPEIHKYREIISELEGYWQEAVQALPSLRARENRDMEVAAAAEADEVSRADAAARLHSRQRLVIVAAISALVGAIAGVMISLFL